MPTPPWLDDTSPYLTAAVPAIGGRIRSSPEDFRVEERPLYLPCGEGEHLYIRVTKRGLSTPDLLAATLFAAPCAERNLSAWPG